MPKHRRAFERREPIGENTYPSLFIRHDEIFRRKFYFELNDQITMRMRISIGHALTLDTSETIRKDRSAWWMGDQDIVFIQQSDFALKST